MHCTNTRSSPDPPPSSTGAVSLHLTCLPFHYYLIHLRTSIAHTSVVCLAGVSTAHTLILWVKIGSTRVSYRGVRPQLSLVVICILINVVLS